MKNTMDTPVKHQPIRHGAGNQRAAVPAVLLCLVLSACGGPDKPVGVVGHVEGFAGLVAADEPRAVLLGRDVLSAGGTPADAAVAMAFAMTVTLPSQVSLGAGGSCLYYDHENKKVEALDFIAPPPAALGPETTRPTAAPELPRGMYALHARYGHLRWEELLGSAETMARMGTPTSRAFALQLAPFAGPLFEDPEALRMFAKADGTPVQEGEMLTQLDLGASLTRLRTRGVGDFYTGRGGDDIVAAAKASGGSLTTDELHAVQPKWVAPLSVKYGDETAYFAPPPASSGMVEAEIWSILAGQGLYGDADAASRPHLLAETFARTYADRAQWLNPEGTSNQAQADLLAENHLKGVMAGYNAKSHDPQGGDAPTDISAGTGLVVVGNDGSAVSCAISLNNSFGTGRVLPNMGFMLAFAPGIKGRGPYSIGPALAINTNSNEFRFAAAAGGGPGAATALTQSLLAAQVGKVPLRDALAIKRVHAVNAPDSVLVEKGSPDVAVLQGTGHVVNESDFVSRVNAAQCGSGRPKAARCSAATDPRGAGLGLTVGSD